MVNRTDEELLPALAKGDEAAFTVVYRRRQGAIYRYALQMTGSAETASEVTQEVFLALMRQGSGLSAERGSVMSWLYAVARRQVFLSAGSNFAVNGHDLASSVPHHKRHNLNPQENVPLF